MLLASLLLASLLLASLLLASLLLASLLRSATGISININNTSISNSISIHINISININNNNNTTTLRNPESPCWRWEGGRSRRDGAHMPGCGLKYRPFKDGPAMLLELKVDDTWVPILSELLPDHIVDRLMLAQAEWYQVTEMSEAKAIQLEIAKHAMHPSTCLIDGLPFTCIGRFPLEEYYASGHKAVTQVQWVKYFYEMARFASELPGSSFPLMEGLAQWMRSPQAGVPCRSSRMAWTAKRSVGCRRTRTGSGCPTRSAPYSLKGSMMTARLAKALS